MSLVLIDRLGCSRSTLISFVWRLQAVVIFLDYLILSRQGTSGIAVMAPHGGGIEPGTSEIANRVAGDEHAYYSFEGLKQN